MKRGLSLVAVVVFGLVSTFASHAAAEPPPTEISDRGRLASDHFRRGRAAYLRQDFQAAGRAFDDAFAAAPHHDVLWNAAQSWENAGEIARAANRYAAYLRLAPATASDRPSATASLASLTRRLGRLHVFASANEQPRVDGEVVTDEVFYVYPGTHVVTVQRKRGTTEREVSVAAGQDASVSFGADPAEAGPSSESKAPSSAPTPSAPTSSELRREPVPAMRPLPPWTVIVGGGLVVVGAGATTFFGLRSLGAKSDFDRHPSADLLGSGRDDQTRTNVALGVTLGIAVVTACVAGLFVEWGPSSSRTSPPAAAIR